MQAGKSAGKIVLNGKEEISFMRKAVDALMRFLSRLLGVLLFIAVLTVLAQIASRYIFRAPFGWTDQLCRFLYVWIIMLGLPVLFHTKAVTAFDSLSSKLGKRQQDILHILVCVLSLAFAVCFAWFGWEFMIKKGGMMIPAFKVIPYYAVYASLPICGVLLFVEMLLQLIETIRSLCRREEEER